MIKAAVSSTGDTVRLIAAILALAISTAAGALVVYLVASR